MSRRGFAENFLRDCRHGVISIDQLQNGIETLRRHIECELLRNNILPESARYLGREQFGCDHNCGIRKYVENGRP